MTSLNFDTDGQLGQMELYSLQLQKIVADFTEFDAVTKAYVDSKVSQAKQELTDGASSALDTFKELEDYLTSSGTAGGLVEQIASLSGQIAAETSRAQGAETTLTSQIAAEQSRAESAESGLGSRLTTLETDATTGADVLAVQTELDTTQTGAGLDHNGTYHQSVAANYINTATNLKDADDLLDQAIKAEETRATTAESTNASNLSTHIASYETDHKQNETDKFEIGQRITNLTTTEIAEGDKLFYTDTRVKNANVHSYEYFNEERKYDAPVEISVGTAFSAIKAELNDIHIKEDADDTRHTDLTVSLSTVAGTVVSETNRATAAEATLNTRIADQEAKQATDDSNMASALSILEADVEEQVGTERTRAEEAEGALSSRVDVFEGGLNNGNVEGSDYYVENLSVQGVVDDLRGGIDYVNGKRLENTEDIADQVAKQAGDKAAADAARAAMTADAAAGFAAEAAARTADVSALSGRINSNDAKHTAHDTRHAGHDSNISELDSTKFDKAGGSITGEVRVNLDASYFYLSDVWRIKTDAVGKRIVFEFNKDTAANDGEGDWVSGIPFISSH